MASRIDNHYQFDAFLFYCSLSEAKQNFDSAEGLYRRILETLDANDELARFVPLAGQRSLFAGLSRLLGASGNLPEAESLERRLAGTRR